jgi:hypothetical protein
MRIRIVVFVWAVITLLAAAALAQPSTPVTSATAPQAATEANTGQQPAVPLLAVVVPAGSPPEQCLIKLRAAAEKFRTTNSDSDLINMLDPKRNTLCFVYLVMSSTQYDKASQNARKKLLSSPSQAEVDLFLRIAKAAKAIAQQEGSSAGTGGSTNLASKGLAAKFISLASEYGALTQSTSNTTTTVQGTLAGLPVVLLKKGLAEECSTKLVALTPCFHSEALNWLNRISYSVSFDTSQNGQSLNGTANGQAVANAQPATFTANSHTINAVSGKFVAWQSGKIDGDTLDSKFKAFTQQTERTQIRQLADFFQLRPEDPRFQDGVKGWRKEALDSIKSAIKRDPSLRSAVDAWKSSGTGFVTNVVPKAPPIPQPAPATATEFEKEAAREAIKAATTSADNAAKEELTVLQNAADFAVHYIEYLGREEEAALSLAKPPILTFEYDENRPAGQPTNSVFRVIYQHKPEKFPKLTLTANGAFSIYDSEPSSSIPGASRLRDVQAAAQADREFQINSAITGKLGVTATGAFYFQYQSSPAILNVDASAPLPGITFTGLPANASQVFAQKGNIYIGQFKLSVGSGSNMKIPLSVTYSNRTELVTKPVWRGQVGISYDFDSLFASPK